MALPGRILAMDLGKRRIGLAVSDPLGVTAQGLETLQRTRIREDLAALAEILDRYQVKLVLMGNPVHMSGDESRQSSYTHEFAERLSEHCRVPVKFWDERWTSMQAERILKESGISIEKRARAVDRISAVILLESYLDSIEGGNPSGPEEISPC